MNSTTLNIDTLPLYAIYLMIKEGRECGMVKELEEELTKDRVQTLEVMGYIRRGIGETGDTFGITERAKKRAKEIYDEPSGWVKFWDKIMGWFYIHIFRVDLKY
ncbi:MAG: hypothetical protein LBN24_06190 [Mediterranea sp.]|jgi:hypothetical protein|nr:hypothetical protein [Mediterranea sp.]